MSASRPSFASDARGTGLRCHRRLLANWWLENTGEVVRELEPGVRQEQLFG